MRHRPPSPKFSRDPSSDRSGRRGHPHPRGPRTLKPAIGGAVASVHATHPRKRTTRNTQVAEAHAGERFEGEKRGPDRRPEPREQGTRHVRRRGILGSGIRPDSRTKEGTTRDPRPMDGSGPQPPACAVVCSGSRPLPVPLQPLTNAGSSQQVVARAIEFDEIAEAHVEPALLASPNVCADTSCGVSSTAQDLGQKPVSLLPHNRRGALRRPVRRLTSPSRARAFQ